MELDEVSSDCLLDENLPKWTSSLFVSFLNKHRALVFLCILSVMGTGYYIKDNAIWEEKRKNGTEIDYPHDLSSFDEVRSLPPITVDLDHKDQGKKTERWFRYYLKWIRELSNEAAQIVTVRIYVDGQPQKDIMYGKSFFTLDECLSREEQRKIHFIKNYHLNRMGR